MHHPLQQWLKIEGIKFSFARSASIAYSLTKHQGNWSQEICIRRARGMRERPISFRAMKHSTAFTWRSWV